MLPCSAKLQGNKSRRSVALSENGGFPPISLFVSFVVWLFSRTFSKLRGKFGDYLAEVAVSCVASYCHSGLRMPTRMVTSLDQPFLPRSNVACKSMCLATIRKLLMKQDRFAAFNHV